MTINEMHIAVNLGVQKIASFQVDNLLPEEIDHELNLAMLRFIKQRYNPTSNRLGKGFEQSQKRIDDLSHLVVQHADYTFTPYINEVLSSTTSPIYVDRITLPADYMFLVSLRARVAHNCGEVITPLFANKTYRFVEVDLTPPAPGYFITEISRFDGTNWVSITNTPLGEEITYNQIFDYATYNFQILPYTGVIDFTNIVISDFNPEQSPIANPNRVYITTNPGDPNSFWTADSGGNRLRSTWVNSQGLSSAFYVYSSKLFPHGVSTRTYKDGKLEIYPCTYFQHDDIFESLDDPFNRSWYRSPSYTFEENSIDFYTDNKFVVDYSVLKYIRKPNPMSLSLGVGCELAEHTHAEIVEMTIKSILEGIQDPRYQSQSIENLESE
jgi:hypothetical protein